MRSGTARWGAIVLGGTLALGACSDEPPKPTIPTSQPTSTTPTTTAASTTPSPTPTATTASPDAAGRALIERYFDTYEASLRSGDTREFRATFTTTCGRCLATADPVDADARAGHVIEGGGYVVTDIRLTLASPLIMQALISQRAVTVKSTTGKVVDTYVATQPSRVTFKMATIKGELKVTEIL